MVINRFLLLIGSVVTEAGHEMVETKAEGSSVEESKEVAQAAATNESEAKA